MVDEAWLGRYNKFQCYSALSNSLWLDHYVYFGSVDSQFCNCSGIAALIAAVGPWIFGKLIGTLGGKYWGGFLFLALLNMIGAMVYFVVHRISKQVVTASAADPIAITANSR